MARMPAASWLGEHSPRTPMERYDIVCVHTIVGFAPAHAAHFSTHANGTISQSRDTRYRSAANLNGNHRVIAIENEDHGFAFPNWSGSNVPRLTDAQVDAIAKILAWAHKTHGVPLQLCPNSKPGSRGLAVHRQGIDGNFTVPVNTLGLPLSMWRGRGTIADPGRWVPDGEVWTETPGKVCPGDRRIAQLPDILARAKQIVNGEDDVTPEDIQKIASAVWAEGVGPEGSVEPARDRLRGAHFQATAANAGITAVATALEELRAGERARHKRLLERLRDIADASTDPTTRQHLGAVVADLEEEPAT